jgi:hypothetical protein
LFYNIFMFNPELAPNEAYIQSEGFSASMDLAFRTLDNSNFQDTNQGTFFRITWSKDQPDVIEKFQLFSTQPTGALRHEHNGRFFSAQFVVSLQDATTPDQVSDNSLQWLDIDPAVPEETLVVDSELVENQHKFQLYTPENLIKQLLPKAKTVQHHDALIQQCKTRGINDLKAIFQSVRITTLRLIDQQVYHTGSGNHEEAQRYFGLIVNYIHMLEGVDNDEMVNLQGKLLSRLFKNLPRDWHTRADARAEASLDTLESGIANGLFPTDQNIMDRIYSIPVAYTRPKLMELLHSYVTSEQFNNKGYNFTKIHRENYTHDFMFSILASRLIDLKGSTSGTAQKVRKLVDSTISVREEKKGLVNFSPIIKLADELGREKQEIPEDQAELEQVIFQTKFEAVRSISPNLTIDKVYEVNFQKIMNSPHILRETVRSFEYILDKLHQEMDSSDPPKQLLDQNAVEIAQRMVDSVIQRQLGYTLVQIFLAEQNNASKQGPSSE